MILKFCDLLFSLSPVERNFIMVNCILIGIMDQFFRGTNQVVHSLFSVFLSSLPRLFKSF